MSNIKKYRKKPVVVEALKFTKGMDWDEVFSFCPDARPRNGKLYIKTPGGTMLTKSGHYIKVFKLKTGTSMRVANDGKPIDEVVIRYKDYYFSVFLDVETGEPTGDFAWSEDATMFHTPIREHYVAKREDSHAEK